jgi:hypothetical protein
MDQYDWKSDLWGKFWEKSLRHGFENDLSNGTGTDIRSQIDRRIDR